MKAKLAFRLALPLAVAWVGILSAPRTAVAEEIDDTVRSVLADPRYRFCHEDDYPLAPDEHDFCPLLESASGACPALPHACRLPPVDRALSMPFGTAGRRHARPGDKPAPAAPDDDARQRPWSCNAPSDGGAGLEAMSLFAKLVFFGILAAFVVLAIQLVRAHLSRKKADAPEPDDEPRAVAPTGAATTQRGAVETDVERLLDRARARAAQGDYAGAVDDAYAALLRRLDGDGLIEIHGSRTNGDYVRALPDPTLRARVKGIVRDVEDVQFGATRASAPAFASVLERVVAIATRAAMLALAILGFGAAVSCDHLGGEGSSSGFSGVSPSGTQAILEVLSKHGLTARHRTTALGELTDPSTLVLYPDAYLDEETWSKTLAWVDEKGGTLILAGLASVPSEIGQRIVDRAGEGGPLSVAPGARWAGDVQIAAPGNAVLTRARDKDAGVDDADGGAAAVDDPPLDGVVLLRDRAPVLSDRRVGEGHVVMVADERLFVNASLAVAENARFLVALLTRVTPVHEGTRLVELVDSWTGAGSQTPIEAVDRAHLTPFLLQLFVLVALFFLSQGIAFAALRDPPVFARRAFVDHARAIGEALRRSRAERHAASLYATWAIERLRERAQGGRGGLVAIAEAVAARTGEREGEVMRVLVEAMSLREEAAPASAARPKKPARGGGPAEDAAVVDRLSAYLKAMGSTRARRSRGTEEKDPNDPD